MIKAFQAQLKNWKGNGIQSLQRIFAPVSDKNGKCNATMLGECAKKFGVGNQAVDSFSGNMDT